LRLRLLLGVALGVAAGLLANRYIPDDGIWPDLIIGVGVGVAVFALIQVIRGKGKIVP
jgi:predicted small secreted protein